MKIETRFDIGAEIHFISIAKKACKGTICGVKTESKMQEGDIMTLTTYLLGNEADYRVSIKVAGNEAFATKEELLKSL